MSDLISREDAILAILNAESKVARETPYDSEVFSVMAKRQNEILDVLVALPSADRPTGRWVRKEKEINDCDGHRAYYWYECDNCGARPPKDRWGHEWHSDFCPNCGAMMEGGEEE